MRPSRSSGRQHARVAQREASDDLGLGTKYDRDVASGRLTSVNDAFDSSELPVESRLPAFDGATAWLNTEPRTAQDLEGRVVLVDFCTYTCINWIRTLPYIRAWANEYGPRGLAVVGVH